jgi:hypothetical protein
MEQIPGMLDSILNDRGDLVTADGANPIVLDFLQSKGFAIYPARKGHHSVQKGIVHLRGFKIVADPNCPITLNEFRRLRWPTERLTGKVISGANRSARNIASTRANTGARTFFRGLRSPTMTTTTITTAALSIGGRGGRRSRWGSGGEPLIRTLIGRGGRLPTRTRTGVRRKAIPARTGCAIV